MISGDFAEIPLVTIDTAFPRLECHLKCFNENARLKRALLQKSYVVQGLSQKMLTCVQRKMAHHLQKVRAQVLQNQVRYDGGYIIACFIHRNDPCKPRWGDDTEWIDTESERIQHRNCQNKSTETAYKMISNCLIILLYIMDKPLTLK